MRVIFGLEDYILHSHMEFQTGEYIFPIMLVCFYYYIKQIKYPTFHLCLSW